MTDLPNSRYEHVFPVVRVDFYDEASIERSDVQNRVTVTKVFTTKDAAQHEVERLNSLSPSSGSLYLVTYGRLVPGDVVP